ncbi:reductase [Psychrobacter sp. JCM 18903]|nr:reductase [Psychrobacter sp. JCM 18903]
MMQTLSALVKQGDIRGIGLSIGLSEVSSETLRQAHAIHPITAVQSEYSLWSRQPEEELLETCRELGVSFVAYSPLGRAFLTGKLDTESLEAGDFRHAVPRLNGEALTNNQQIVKQFSKLATEWQYSNAQLCLAWLLNKHPHVIPIAGTRHEKYLIENAQATKITLKPSK